MVEPENKEITVMLARFAADPSYKKNISNYRFFEEQESTYRSNSGMKK